MESSRIKHLIEKYYDGATSREEERAITDYFLSHPSLDKELEVERAMFLGLSKMRDERAPLTTSDIKPMRRRAATLWLGRVAAVAAVAAVAIVALIVGGGVWEDYEAELDYTQDIICYIDGKEVTNSELALSETSRLLGSVANNMTLAMASIEKYNPLNK